MASDLSQSQTASTPRRKSLVATIGLLILAIGVVLYLASNILIPVTLAQSLTLPLGFLVLTGIEGQLVTPSILGHRMSLNPPFVVLAVVLWGWLWSIVGALLAVPLLFCFTTIAENIPGLQATTDFFRGGRKTGRGRGQAER